MVDVDLCKRIICGAVSQRDAGYQALLECSHAGYVGALPCSHPECQPYKDETPCRISPVNQITVNAVTGTPAIMPVEVELFQPTRQRAAPVITPPDLVPILPNIVEKPVANKVIDYEERRQAIASDMCRINNWVSTNPLLALMGLVGVFGLLGAFKKGV